MKLDFSRPLLAIDTSTSVLSLALSHQNQLWQFHQEVSNKQSELILPQIRALLAESSLQITDLAAIVYAQGPGAFTGLRIGAGVTQGLATPFHIPLIGVPTLDAVASQIQAPCVLAATDARMGEVFYAWFNTECFQRLSDYQVGKAEEIQAISETQVIGIGNAFALDNPPPFTGTSEMPSAVALLDLAKTERYPALPAEQAELLYVRNKIALTAQEQAARKANA
ncbi:MAG: tRNA (adenosine(37)-N6)-threonylcarbamoyltransferase complex dimerization subunit type 1 TsaB [Neisseria sp.]|nr:tRNA (adenosine(37)-N6)-threonylcarbamoyltransferase complex dimerization subunit type 1 TsaB [Neisseria sp.]